MQKRAQHEKLYKQGSNIPNPCFCFVLENHSKAIDTNYTNMLIITILTEQNITEQIYLSFTSSSIQTSKFDQNTDTLYLYLYQI